ncbi:MAG: serine hydrolase domain-containing protein [Actinomycetota bacterium]
MPIRGTCEPGFETVRDAFARNFAEYKEVGAACCVYVGGRPVIDIWDGTADVATDRPWAEDTIVLVYSSTKGVTATAANLLVERGAIDLDAPVAEYWPEFAAGGKDTVAVRTVLSHQAGLPVVDGDFTIDDVLAWHPVVDALATQAPRWELGTAHGYHMRTFGWLVGELVRRVTGRTIGRFVADELAGPLGLDFWIGLPEEQEPRCATLVPAGDSDLVELLPEGTLLREAIPNPGGLFAYDERWNTRPFHAAELPSSNGIGDARSLARLYASLIGEVDGVRLLAPDTVKAAATPQARGTDAVLMIETAYGLGFMLPPSLDQYAGAAAFGHAGAGGSLAFADPDAGFAFAYVMNQLRFDVIRYPRAPNLVKAVYESLSG